MIKGTALALLLIVSSFSLSAMERFEQLGWIKPGSELESLIQYPHLLERVYQENNDQLIWFDNQVINQFEYQLDVIRRAGFSPLFIRQLNQMQAYRERNSMFEYDLLATDTLLLYLSYAEQAPKIGMAWFFESKLNQLLAPPSQDALFALHVAVEVQGIIDLLNLYTPKNPTYDQLLHAYDFLLSTEKAEVSLYQQRGLKKLGDKLSHRFALIERLSLVNIDVTSVRDNVTWYDNSLVKPVKEFQTMHGLQADGIIGPETIKWLNFSLSDRLSMLALNAERMRLWPEANDTLIVVNVPSFDMRYWHLGQEVFQSKVVVGRSSRKTPLMITKLDSLILNPTWNVPYKIMVEDILPMVKKDSSYLARHNIDIVSSWRSEELIDPNSINWSTVNPAAFPYRMRQQAGKSNALGLYKFNTPNRRAIYLHDTPSKSLFNNSSRAFSSGCVRVQNADKFASMLLETQGISEKQLVDKDGLTNAAIPLKKRIPVHIIYQTVWYEGGELHYRDDIYHYDTFSYRNG
ncbi:L,D-transpeptidase family protein [Vibrio aestuarianus]|uniref:L,D-transpeptidase family protein n=1 Tax=Vibrio aestuarianus TaxID=28171 RepID=UPI001559C71F|nr:L,D-transpeptidase family protein [Vibrio aestuarianus]MDE1235661.1 L,D-transpeptidase family protein [Vibrio aestuarianus]MDE1246523.1 L,D-transpeptidase family protein [Vibrio aestuarianus]NGZ63684.1 L,D-transpeptidase family protein [Vibrio aestuarianus subsp. cardii]NGZ66805.1 L,D-transpeptidase family protein [Vibrio aestuarianus subsp. cardii]